MLDRFRLRWIDKGSCHANRSFGGGNSRRDRELRRCGLMCAVVQLLAFGCLCRFRTAGVREVRARNLWRRPAVKPLCPCGSGRRYETCCRNGGYFRRRETPPLRSGNDPRTSPRWLPGTGDDVAWTPFASPFTTAVARAMFEPMEVVPLAAVSVGRTATQQQQDIQSRPPRRQP